MLQAATLTDCSAMQDRSKLVLTLPDCQPFLILNGEASLAVTIAGNFDVSIREAEQIARRLFEGLNNA
ncbi:hypothetical protein B9T38_04100 [Acinetobacter sp. ANC 4218]|nr:hypothetical protein B9T38_04100 [Acinetobacter sp. ANC 4218]